VLTPAQPVPPAAAVIRVNCAPQLLLRRGKDTADSSRAAENGMKRKTVSACCAHRHRRVDRDEVAQLTAIKEVVGEDHTHVLDVVCLLASVAEVFDHFVVSVIERLSATDESATTVETVLQRWREFAIAPSGPTGRDRLAEILSKLLDVSDAVHASEVPRIEFWVGPFGARHDMRCGSMAVEVTTTRSRTGHRVTTIRGADQLLAPEQGVSVRLGVRVRKTRQPPDATSCSPTHTRRRTRR